MPPRVGPAVRRVCEPTNCAAGSEGKILVMTQRAARRELLFHPEDNTRKVQVAVSAGGRVGRQAKRPGGVSYDAGHGMYRARVRRGGVRVFLGWFRTEGEASAAVEAAGR
jgi:hypothetical protein